MTASAEDLRYTQIETAYNTGRYAYSAELGQQFLVEYPESGVGWALLGLTLLKLARYDEARAAIRRSIARIESEHVALPCSWMGDLYVRKGDIRRAIIWYRRSIEAEPDHGRGYLFLGLALMKAGDVIEAEANFRKALTCRGINHTEVYLNLGMALRSRGHYREALRALRVVLERSPSDTRAQRVIEDIELLERHRRAKSFVVIHNRDHVEARREGIAN